MKKFLLSAALLVVALSCSKDLQDGNQKPIKKTTIPTDPEVVLGLVETFTENYNDTSYSPSQSDEIDYEYGVWLVEASLNFTNRGDGETEKYVDFGNSLSDDYDAAYSTDGSDVLISEAELFNMFEAFETLASQNAPFTDLEIAPTDVGGLKIVGEFFPEAVDPPYNCVYTIQTLDRGWGADRPSSSSSTCYNGDPSIEIINSATDWVGNNGNCYAYVAWGYSIDLYVLAYYNNNPSLDHWKMAHVDLSSGMAQLTNVGSGTDHMAAFWGATELTNGQTPRPFDECFWGAGLQSMESDWESVINTEISYLPPIIFNARLETTFYIKSGFQYKVHTGMIRAGAQGLTPGM